MRQRRKHRWNRRDDSFSARFFAGTSNAVETDFLATLPSPDRHIVCGNCAIIEASSSDCCACGLPADWEPKFVPAQRFRRAKKQRCMHRRPSASDIKEAQSWPKQFFLLFLSRNLPRACRMRLRFAKLPARIYQFSSPRSHRPCQSANMVWRSPTRGQKSGRPIWSSFRTRLLKSQNICPLQACPAMCRAPMRKLAQWTKRSAGAPCIPTSPSSMPVTARTVCCPRPSSKEHCSTRAIPCFWHGRGRRRGHQSG